MAVDSLGVLETLRSMPEQLAKAHETAGEGDYRPQTEPSTGLGPMA